MLDSARDQIGSVMRDVNSDVVSSPDNDRHLLIASAHLKHFGLSASAKALIFFQLVGKVTAKSFTLGLT